MSRKVTVLHAHYGCDTGCCGHIIEVNGRAASNFEFSHPAYDEDFRSWAEALVREQLGADHVADLDWENCTVSDD
jgi:hypothetical protein